MSADLRLTATARFSLWLRLLERRGYLVPIGQRSFTPQRKIAFAIAATTQSQSNCSHKTFDGLHTTMASKQWNPNAANVNRKKWVPKTRKERVPERERVNHLRWIHAAYVGMMMCVRTVGVRMKHDFPTTHDGLLSHLFHSALFTPKWRERVPKKPSCDTNWDTIH